MAIPDYILIVANSGRMLAEEVVKAGLNALVVDLFADTDTQGLATAVHCVPSLALENIAPAVGNLIDRFSVKHMIYGSGLEIYDESLHYLAGRLQILGNTPETFIRLQNKRDFFSVLTELKIEFPVVSFQAPHDGNDWLVKQMRGQGGVGIRRYRPGQTIGPGSVSSFCSDSTAWSVAAERSDCACTSPGSASISLSYSWLASIDSL